MSIAAEQGKPMTPTLFGHRTPPVPPRRVASTRRGHSASWVYDTLREGFRDGYYAPDHLFSEYELMRFFNVTRASVREALERLTEEGLLSRSPKRGTQPRSNSVHVTVDEGVSFRESGQIIPGQHREEMMATSEVSAAIFVSSRLGVPEGTVVRMDESLVTVADEPFAICMFYSRIGQIPERGMAGEGNYTERVRKLGFRAASIDSAFEAISADPVTAARLRVAVDSPILLRILTFFGEDDSRLLSIIRMRGDRAVVHTHRPVLSP